MKLITIPTNLKRKKRRRTDLALEEMIFTRTLNTSFPRRRRKNTGLDLRMSMMTVTPRKKRSIKEIDPTMIMKNLPKRKGVLGLQIIMTTITGKKRKEITTINLAMIMIKDIKNMDMTMIEDIIMTQDIIGKMR